MKYINDIIKEYNNLGIGEQIDYAKFYMYSIITHSTAIEGSTVTEIENRLLFDEGIGTQKPFIEQMMNLDLKAAYEQSLIYAREHRDYSVELLCQLSAKQYIESLERSQDEENSTPFLLFMLKHHCDNILEQIAEFKKSIEKTSVNIVNVADKLTERQKIIINIIQNVAVNVAVNTKYLSEKLCVNRKTVQRDLVELQKRQLIKWVGSDKTGHWEII